MNNFKYIFTAIALLATTATAQAELRICNETADTQGISIGYLDGDTPVSEGWWNLDTNECATVIREPLQEDFYFLRAEIAGGPFTGEGHFFCTTPEEYTIRGADSCDARGYDSEDFIAIYVGNAGGAFTYRLANRVQSSVNNDPEGLTICNETPHTQALSVGYRSNGETYSEGWWNIESGSCATPLRGPLQTRLYYIRAEVNGGPFQGDVSFCTTPEEYTIVGHENCTARGYDGEAFREIDTGATARTFRYTLR